MSQPLTGSPIQYAKNRFFSSPLQSGLPTPISTPLATTAYSPFRSAGLRPPTPYERVMSPKAHRRGRHGRGSLSWSRPKRILMGKATWLLIAIFLMACWWNYGGVQNLERLQLHASGFAREHLRGKQLVHYQFFPASNPKIHVRVTQALKTPLTESQYTGRWTSTPNRLRRDGTFPGTLCRAESDIWHEMVSDQTPRYLSRRHSNQHHDSPPRPSQ